MDYSRMPIEAESPEERGYSTIRYNLAESSYRDLDLSFFLKELNSAPLAYSDHRGIPELRRAIAEHAGNCDPQQVLVCPGAAGALFFIHQAFLNPGDHLLVLFPNYGTNLATPEAMSVEVEKIHLSEENHWEWTAEEIMSKYKPSTRLISITQPHNPTGRIFLEQEILKLATFCEEKNIPLLIDETYADLLYKIASPRFHAASPHILSVSSLSKSFGIPGIRMGWVISQNPIWLEKILAVKEQVVICNSLVDEMIATIALNRKKEILSAMNKLTSVNRSIVLRWLEENNMIISCSPPQGGVVCFPRIIPTIDLKEFYRELLEERQTMVGPGHWFGMSDAYFRLGFGWPEKEELEAGLTHIREAILNKA